MELVQEIPQRIDGWKLVPQAPLEAGVTGNGLHVFDTLAPHSLEEYSLEEYQ